MNLLAVHRLLIWSFIGFAVVFGWVMLRRYLDAGDEGGLVGAIVAVVVVVGGLIYLAKAPHLRRK